MGKLCISLACSEDDVLAGEKLLSVLSCSAPHEHKASKLPEVQTAAAFLQYRVFYQVVCLDNYMNIFSGTWR